MRIRGVCIIALAAAALLASAGPAAARVADAPGNDMFANAVPISGASGSASGSNVGATKEAGEPATVAGNSGGASVWWSWTAPSSGAATITTAGSSFDTLLGVYTGGSVSALTSVAESDDVSDTDKTSSVTFTASAGTTYAIMVDGYDGPRSGQATGSVTLNWSLAAPPPPPAPPPNDMFANAQSVSGSSGTATGTNVGATKEAGEPSLAGNSGGASVWYRWTAPSNGSATVTTEGSSFDTLLGVFTGTSVSALTTIGQSDDVSDTDKTSSVTFTASAGTTYLIAVDGYDGSRSGQATGSVTLNWSLAAAPAPPANDLFANAQPISGSSGTASGTNVGATKEAGEPSIAGNSGGASVWYRWTAGSSGTATVTTAGSSFDTLLGVYTGSSVSALTSIVENDDVSSTDHTSSVTFAATAGTTYRIAVDGYDGPRSGQATGSISLNWTLSSTPSATAPPNDMFANAQSVSGSSGKATGTNVGATKEAGEPSLAGNSGGASVWYRWTAPSSGSATVTTEGSSFDTLLGVFTGTSVSALTSLAQNDDVSSSDHTSSVTFAAAAGRTYMIAVDGYHGPQSGQATGSIALNWSVAAPPANDMFANALVLSGSSGTVSGTNVGATKEAGEPSIAGNSGGASVWYRWTAPSNGSASFKTAGSSFDTLLGVYTGSSVSALTSIVENDDVSSTDHTSAVSLGVVGGTTYMVAVDGYHGPVSGQATGSIALAWSFSAAPTQPPSTDPTLLAAGDVAYCPNGPAASGAAQTAQILGQFPSAWIAVLGDGAYQDGSATDYSTCYAPTWGQYKGRTRPSAGYHDYNTPNASGYFGYWGSAAGPAGQGWYSWDLGTWHIVVLNSPLCDQSCNQGSAQIQWLQSDLAAHPNRCTLAYFAYPLFTSGTEDGPDPAMRNFWNVLYAKGVDVVLNGHEHGYERFAPQAPNGSSDPTHGIREFVVGTGGMTLYPFGRALPNSQVRYDGSWGVLKLTLHSGSYDWQFVPVAGSSFSDSGSGTCH